MTTSAPSTSPSPGPSTGPVNRHALTPLEKQKKQLEKLLKDPAKPAFVPAPPKEKTVRAPREMMKNVQGSSAGAGSGEFHVYKAARRREYERLKLMDEKSQKEAAEQEFEEKKRKWEEDANNKTAKNRAKRMKKKERSKVKGKAGAEESNNNGQATTTSGGDGSPLKKKRLIGGGREVVFKLGGNDEDESEEEGDEPTVLNTAEETATETPAHIAETSKIVFHEDD